MKKLKDYAVGAMFMAVLIAVSTTVFAAINKNINVTYADIKIKVNGNIITPKDGNGATVEPFSYNGTTYLPVRAVANALGCDVGWDQNSMTVSIDGQVSGGGQSSGGGNTSSGSSNSTARNMIDILAPYRNDSTVDWFTTSDTDSIKLGGNDYKNSLSMRARQYDPVYANFNLESKYTLISGIIGHIDNSSGFSSADGIMTVNFYGDGNLIKTIEVPCNILPTDFSLNVTGVRDLKIELLKHFDTPSLGLAELKIQ